MSRGSMSGLFQNYTISISLPLIHHKPQFLPRKISPQIVRKQFVMPMPDLLRQPGGMRRNQQIFQVPQRRIFGQRLLFKHIQSGSSNASRLQRLDQRLLIHLRPAPYIDKVRTRLHRPETRGIDQSPRVFDEWRRQHDEVRFLQQLIHCRRRTHSLDPGRPSLLHMLAHRNHAHARPASHLPPAPPPIPPPPISPSLAPELSRGCAPSFQIHRCPQTRFPCNLTARGIFFASANISAITCSATTGPCTSREFVTITSLFTSSGNNNWCTAAEGA